MALDKLQIDTLKQWIADGASVADVQKRIESEFGVLMTYMDTRFLIDDIGAELVDKKPVVSANDDLSAAATPEPESTLCETDESLEDGLSTGSEAQQPSEHVGGVSVSVSPVQRPDCIVSGEAVFSDGSKSEWRIDRMGQLGLIPLGGKNPPQSDMYEFQRKLQDLLSRM